MDQLSENFVQPSWADTMLSMIQMMCGAEGSAGAEAYLS
jgi:hypothetical protein